MNLSVPEELNRDKFLVWQAMVLPDIRGAQLFELLDGTMSAPYKEVKATDKGIDNRACYLCTPEAR
jgi:hypothetical protein